jgi:N-acetylmuramoyl-L-alanine amidase
MKPARACTFGAIGAVLIAMAAAARAATITSASLATHGNIVELHFTIRGEGLSWSRLEQHQQLIINLENVHLKIPSRPLEGQTLEPITSVEAYAISPREGRVVIEVNGKVDYAITLAIPQLIVRFARAGSAPEIATPIITRSRVNFANSDRRHNSFSHSEGIANSAKNSVTANSNDAPERIHPVAVFPPQSFSSTPLVVIDPGHGGRDPGTRSASGIAEKDLALQIALRLRRALETAGVRAELTRTDDRFLTLAERTQIANQAHANLFISVHLNASPDANTTGIETYYLNNTTDRATIRLARMENSGEGRAATGVPNLNYILTDLRQGDKANEAESLSRMIEAETVAAIAASSGIRANNLGARSGPFYVLVGAEMPSVLVECGFLSNPSETNRLSSPNYQAGLADGIAAAVTNYFNGDLAVGNL